MFNDEAFKQLELKATNMATMEYKGYVAQIDTDEENDGFHGVATNIGDTVNFKGRSMKELKKVWQFDGRILRILQRARAHAGPAFLREASHAS